MNNREKFFLGYPCSLGNLCYVFPPLIKDIIANEHYGIYVQLLTLSQEEIQEKYERDNIQIKRYPTPLEYLLQGAYHNKDIEKLVYEAFHFYLHQEVKILYEKKLIVIGDLKESLKSVKRLEDLQMITEDNFFDFQNLVREASGQPKIEPPDPNEDPRVTRMKAKARYRDKIKMKHNSHSVSLLNSLSSLCCMGIGITPFNIGDLSYVALHSLSQKYNQKDSYFLQMQARMNAFAKSKGLPPKYWVADEIK